MKGVFRAALSALALTGVVLALLAGNLLNPVRDLDIAQPHIATPSSRVIPGVRLKAAEPRTVDGYRKMFDSLPVTTWGGADISLTVRVGDSIVWLFGDTLTEYDHKTVLARNSALIQRGSSLRLLRNGFVPNGPKRGARRVIYWPEAAWARGNRITVLARPVSVGTGGVWDFRAGARTHVATYELTASGLTWRGWRGWRSPPSDSPLSSEGTVILGPSHYAYQRIVHHDIPLKGGYLVTTSQNWDNPMKEHIENGRLRYSDWRPLFSTTTNG